MITNRHRAALVDRYVQLFQARVSGECMGAPLTDEANEAIGGAMDELFDQLSLAEQVEAFDRCTVIARDRGLEVEQTARGLR